MRKKARLKRADKYDPTLVAMLLALSDGDVAAGRAVADWLTEQDDYRAAEARELAEAHCVVPPLKPYYWRLKGGFFDWDPYMRYAERCPAEAPNAHRMRVPMAWGPWWSIFRVPEGVQGDFYYETPQGCALNDAWGWAGYRPLAEIPPAEQTDARLRAGFEHCRAEFIIGLCGHITNELDVCTACGRGYAHWEACAENYGQTDESYYELCIPCRRRKAGVG